MEALGTNFVANRSMAIFIMILVITGTLERNGLKEAAAELMKKVKSATAGKLVAAVRRGIFWAFNRFRQCCRIRRISTSSYGRRCGKE